ncbi:hypothetical protein BCR34DRAFT_320673 [Clohesyomyces aquaticus]|uniref:Uncharacterized protein n=1 Tax=Clohesyomyces aquaticus TaxID=1231657 RepID=A0A1Y2A7R1_9PLEO|nr:hypothetical protein BCR34DRAFT_320673 [Clohesyomyces aquaticus]
MRFSASILVSLPLLAAAAMRPAINYANPLLAPRDDTDPLHAYCSVDGKDPKDCGQGWCCYYYEECRAGTDGQDYPFCMDMQETSTGGQPFSVVALQFATTGIASVHASATAHASSAVTSTAHAGPTGTTATAAAASSTGAASNNKVGVALSFGMIAGFAGMLV